MMPQESWFVGIDVSARTLEIRVLHEAKSWSVPNTKAGWTQLVRHWKGRPVVVGIEPSGGYEQDVVRALVRAGIAVRWADPARVRALARALGAPAKTDPIDAEMIARYVAETGGRPVELDDDRQALRELMAARSAVQGAAQRLTQQAKLLSGAPRQVLLKLAKAASQEAKLLRRQLIEMLQHHPRLNPDWRLLQTAPGVGPLVAAELVAEMPELGHVSGKAIAKLAGVAPFIRQSGAWRGKATCSGGRPRPRCALYMAAMTGLRINNGLRAIFEHLVARGKHSKVALVACMRRLLVALNAMMAGRSPWRGLAA
jgi:transposase